ncbi:hypothetical protein FACS1894214_0090 [Planctomycetales bacterium]|nr:hypothetical protein FACS1894214_0090 [Planctomycetales bacterium]
MQWYYESKLKEQSEYTFQYLMNRKICMALVNTDAYNECSQNTHNAYLDVIETTIFGSINRGKEQSEAFDAVTMWKRLYRNGD